MALILFSGRPRTGKTYNAVRFVCKNYTRKGIHTYTNIPLNLSGEYDHTIKGKQYYDQSNVTLWKRLPELYNVKNGVILMDEGHIYMNARKWEKLPEEFQWKLFQHGKDRIDIVMTVQSQRRLDTVARELVDYWYNCTRLPKARSAISVRNPILFRYHEYDIDSDPYKEYPLGMAKILLPQKKWYRRYDTMYKLTGEIETDNVTKQSRS